MKNLPVLAPSAIDLVYAAGFFDGEGSIGIYCRHIGPRERETYLLQVTAAQAVPAPILWLQERWGGHVHAGTRKAEIRPDRRGIRSDAPIFIWSLAARRAAAFLMDIRPWLLVKGEQADVAITFQATRRWGGLGRGPGAEQARQEHAAVGAVAKFRLVEIRREAMGR